ncbi:MAG TPA: 16S rRNA (guanine(527)-N(7))-methyltransferase RsmG [Puia sp.]|nr:16S rRNA (guanine(527)-N(7))-methyltransferase RsmG [Puia sp.]
MEKAEAKLELITRYFTDFSSQQLQQLTRLDEIYRAWNEKINVISRKDIDSLYEKHVLHSLSIAAIFEFAKGNEIIDIGTGGGFPGIPLAIFFPEVQFHLVDSIGKKIKVVEAVADAIGLQNITTQHGRAEEIKSRKFDCVVSRAVAPLKELRAWSRPLLRRQTGNGLLQPDEVGEVPHGLICLKGGDLALEISASGTRPKIFDIHQLFPLEYFRKKYLLYVPAT